MLKVSVGVSKKLTKDYNSEGFSLNLEGEVTAPVDDPQAVIEEIKQFYDLAEEALAQQVERSQSTAAMASRDEEPRAQATNNGRRVAQNNGHDTQAPNGNGHKDEAATNKQLQYLLSIGKRMRLTTVALEKEISEILGSQVGLYNLTKKQAGTVIEQLANPASSRA